MADNTVLPGTGETYAADDISGIKHQRVKISSGVAGEATDVSEDNPLPVTDPNLEIAIGSVTGRSIIQRSGRNPLVGTSFEDVWDVGGTLTYPTSGEQWEIVSDDANDTSVGTGARTVMVTYLDDNYDAQTETLTLNGTTPVSFVATDSFRFVSARVATWGATAENEGNITIQVDGGGASQEELRGRIVFDGEMGLNASQDVHITVPAGMTAFPTIIFANATKDHDITVRALARLEGEDGFFLVGETGVYQNSIIQDFSSGPAGLPEKTDIKVIVKSNNASVIINSAVIMTLIDNAQVNLLRASMY